MSASSELPAAITRRQLPDRLSVTNRHDRLRVQLSHVPSLFRIQRLRRDAPDLIRSDDVWPVAMKALDDGAALPVCMAVNVNRVEVVIRDQRKNQRARPLNQPGFLGPSMFPNESDKRPTR